MSLAVVPPRYPRCKSPYARTLAGRNVSRRPSCALLGPSSVITHALPFVITCVVSPVGRRRGRQRGIGAERIRPGVAATDAATCGRTRPSRPAGRSRRSRGCRARSGRCPRARAALGRRCRPRAPDLGTPFVVDPNQLFVRKAGRGGQVDGRIVHTNRGSSRRVRQTHKTSPKMSGLLQRHER